MDSTKRFEGTGGHYFCQFRHLVLSLRCLDLPKWRFFVPTTTTTDDDDRQNRLLDPLCRGKKYANRVGKYLADDKVPNYIPTAVFAKNNF